MKKFIWVVLTIFIAATSVFFTGCQSAATTVGDTSSTSVVADATSSAANAEPITITVFQYKVEFADAYEKLNAEFTNKYPNITVEMDNVPSPPYFDTLKAKLASDEMPDIFNLLAGRSYVEPWKDVCEDLSGEPWVDRVSQAAVSALIASDEKLVGAPYILDGYGIVYNKTLFKKAGIEKAPTTLTELRDAAEKLEAAGIQPFICSYNDVAQFVRRMFTAAFAKRPDYDVYFRDVVEKGGDFSNDPIFYQYLDFIDLTKEFGNDDALTMDFNTERSKFLNGEAAMTPGEGMWMQSIAANANIDIDMGLMTIPISDDADKEDMIFSIPQTLCINKNSPNVEACKTYINFLLTSQEGAEFMESIKGFPTYLDSTVAVSEYGNLAVDFDSFIKRNKSCVMLGASFPSAAQENIMAELQKYYAGADREETISAIEDAWNNNLETY